MPEDELIRTFKESVASEIDLHPEGADRYRVFAPFGFDDGDEFAIVLKREGASWIFTDEGNTLMHLSYDINLDSLEKGVRRELMTNALVSHQIVNRRGELTSTVQGTDFGGCFYAFVQGLSKIADLTYLSRDRVRTTFKQDVQNWLTEFVPEGRRRFDWYEQSRDPEGRYRVDCRINGRYPPVFVHALSNNDRTRDATITLHRFTEWGIAFESVGIFKREARITKQVRERFQDVCNLTFVGLKENESLIQDQLDLLTSDYY